MKIGELIYNLVFESDTTKLNDFIKAVGTLDMSSIMGALGVGQLYEVTKKLLNSATATAMGLKTFESVTGLSALKMKSWSDVAEQAGVNAGAFESSIKSLQQSITSTRFGNPDQGLIQAYSILNQYGKASIKLTDDLFLQIDKIREGLKSLTPEAQRYVLTLLHQDETMLNLYKAESKLYDQRNNQAVMNREEMNTLTEFWKSAKSAAQGFGVIMGDLAIPIAKWLTPLMEFISKLEVAIHKFMQIQVEVEDILKIFSPLFAGLKFLSDFESKHNIVDKVKGFVGNAIDRTGEFMGRGLVASHPLAPSNLVAYAGMMPNVNSVFYINGDNPQAMKHAAKEAQKEAIAEAYHNTPARNY